MDAARAALRKRFAETDFAIAESLVAAALGHHGSVSCSAAELRDRVGKIEGIEALCALQLLEQAQKADKTLGLSYDEQLLFVVVKGANVLYTEYTMSPHKALFMLLTNRTAKWWDMNHSRTLHTISMQ